MKKFKQLQPQDTFFIAGETDVVYQHTGGLVILERNDPSEFGFEDFREFMEERVGKVPHFRWKLHEVPLGLDLPYWVEDENFSFDRHLRRIAVPSPGDSKALGELVSFLYCRHLDRKHPLWEAWFIEGLENNQCAVFQKLHHCVMDGEGANNLSKILVDFEPHAKPREIDSTISEARAGEVPKLWKESIDGLLRLYGFPVKASREAVSAIWPMLRKKMLRNLSKDKQSNGKQKVPIACFNAEVSDQRGFVFGSLPLADIKMIKDHFGVTVNDVVLAIVSGSLRNYLLRLGELPEKSLRTSIAVSLRTSDDDQFSNRITSVGVTMATDKTDPLERLQTIAAETAVAKTRARSGSNKGLLEIVEMLPPFLVAPIISLTPPDQAVRMSGFNLLVSSVRGSDRPMYMRGARQANTFPMSILGPGMGINVTCISYCDHVDFGITVEPSLVPDAWSLIDGLTESLDEYKALIGKKYKKKTSRNNSKSEVVLAKKSGPKKNHPAKNASKAKAHISH